MAVNRNSRGSGSLLGNPLPPPLILGPEEGVDFLAFPFPEAAESSLPDCSGSPLESWPEWRFCRWALSAARLELRLRSRLRLPVLSSFRAIGKGVPRLGYSDWLASSAASCCRPAACRVYVLLCPPGLGLPLTVPRVAGAVPVKEVELEAAPLSLSSVVDRAPSRPRRCLALGSSLLEDQPPLRVLPSFFGFGRPWRTRV